MKKVILFTASLLSILSLSAASGDFETLTSAILNNDSQQVRSHLLKTKYSLEDLKNAFKMAQEKNKFYHQRLKRWEMGVIAATLGASLGVILSIVAGAGGLLGGIEVKERITGEQKHHSPEDPFFYAGLGGVAGGALGTGAATALAVWVAKKVKKWQSLADESDRIFFLIALSVGENQSK